MKHELPGSEGHSAFDVEHSVAPASGDPDVDVHDGGTVNPWPDLHEKREQIRRRVAVAAIGFVYLAVLICFSTDLYYQPQEASSLLFERTMYSTVLPVGWLFGAPATRTAVRVLKLLKDHFSKQ